MGERLAGGNVAIALLANTTATDAESVVVPHSEAENSHAR